MVNRIAVTLEQPEYSGLLEIAVAELRDPSDQLRHILRTELKRRGLWPLSNQQDASRPDQPAEEVVR